MKRRKKEKERGGKDRRKKGRGEGGRNKSKMSKKCHGMCVINIVENITVPSYWTTMGIGK